MSKKNDHKHHKRTITTGPFYVSRVTNNGGPNDLLIIIIKNPTNRTLQADLSIETCLPPSSPPTTTPEETNEVAVNAGFGRTPIHPHHCLRLEIPIAAFQNHALRVTSTGDYEVGEDRPKHGKLEITVIGGTGIFGGSSGLITADPTLFFRYGDFVVGKDEDDE
ncbi:hypothetical protein PP175_02785 [Aneurinibacillus sp. Ricciae_BoGa-3]|uniref:hypothetical protein n=1 Tax=Aneurinibacillus sp. Ricciae_BoGa-3 TaxID=3022697 RepID=UPI0023401EA3|nr:hypothetical protein [Aneurinibacillus sp. Ricciae_BoGa-3]WCK54960.1 hypothetical protein PP175_02785 [Aneurinibacillus sp. Ricciae_BoGa-3]